MDEYALRITETMSKMQKEFKCSICCSTFKNPILATCSHVFCKDCLDGCFARKRKLQCPICRQIIDKRSCGSSYQLDKAVQYYLKLSEAFKKDVGKQSNFSIIPPELAFCESQMPQDITIIPENDGKRFAPAFLLPLLPPTRRKRASKTAPPAPPPPAKLEPMNEASTSTASASTSAVSSTFCEKEVQTENNEEISVEQLKSLKLREKIAEIQNQTTMLSEIEALFELLPELQEILKENFEKISKLFGKIEENSKEDQENVEFCEKNQPNTENQKEVSNRIPETSKEKPNEIPQIEPFALILPPNQIAEVKPTLNDDDEVVSESDEEKEIEEKIDITTFSQVSSNKRNSDLDATFKCIQNESQILNEDLELTPKVIVCSRMSNEKSEELCADFYYLFLSNSCRFEDEITEKTTHLVMMNSENRHIPQKSLMYAYAVARKCLVLSRDWLADCVWTKTLLNEANYTIQSAPTSIREASFEPLQEIEKPLGWEKSRERLNGPPLFSGIHFLVLRRFAASKILDYKKVIDLIQICGGQIFNPMTDQKPDKLYIVFSEYSESIIEAVQMERQYHSPVITCEWVLDSISEFKVLPVDNYLAKNVHRNEEQ